MNTENSRTRSIQWKLNLASPREQVFEYLNSDLGRSKFWAESAVEANNMIYFRFINGAEYESRILYRKPFEVFKLEYFHSKVEFYLSDNDAGGTILKLMNWQVPENEFNEVHSGWVSVLLTLKASIDYGIDIRNHDQNKSWTQGYVEN